MMGEKKKKLFLRVYRRTVVYCTRHATDTRYFGNYYIIYPLITNRNKGKKKKGKAGSPELETVTR